LDIGYFHRIVGSGYRLVDLDRLISEPNGDASLSRFQFLVFTFVIAMSLFLIIVSTKSFPTIPGAILALLGISGGSYVVSKGIQTSRDLGAKNNEDKKSEPVG
jgi:uncharacterized BrkB/YihY/UPF0761 family membrane protein